MPSRGDCGAVARRVPVPGLRRSGAQHGPDPRPIPMHGAPPADLAHRQNRTTSAVLPQLADALIADHHAANGEVVSTSRRLRLKQ